MAREKSLPGSAQRAECTPGLPSSACTTRPELSASAGRPEAFAAACALMRALAAKLSPSSTGSGRPSAALAITSMRSGCSRAASSRTLPGLWVASTRRGAVEAPRQAHGSRASAWRCRAISWRTPALGEIEHGLELVALQRHVLGGELHLDQAAGAGEHEIGVGLRGAVLGIVEIQPHLAVDDAAGDRGDRLAQRQGRQLGGIDQALEGLVQGDIGAGDRRGARAAVGAQHVAVQHDLALAGRLQVRDGAQAAADQALDLLGPAGLAAARGLAVGAPVGGARQHAVLGGHPAAAGVAQERRHPLLHRGGAQHMGVAGADQAGAFGLRRMAELEA